MRYKGYEALVSFNEEDRVLHGRVLNTRDVISFEAGTAGDIEQAFHEAIDDYLEQCAESGCDPDKPFSGKLVLRIDPDLHRDAYLEAVRDGTSPERLDRPIPEGQSPRASQRNRGAGQRRSARSLDKAMSAAPVRSSSGLRSSS